jgi:hypothetical protein
MAELKIIVEKSVKKQEWAAKEVSIRDGKQSLIKLLIQKVKYLKEVKLLSGPIL